MKKLIGASWFGGWKDDPSHPFGPLWTKAWFWGPDYPEREPLLIAGQPGWYDEGKQSVIDIQLKQLIDGGLDYVAVNWYYSNLTKGPAADHALQGIIASPVSGIQFALSYDSNTTQTVASLADLKNVYDCWREIFMNPKYLRIGGRPVLFIGKLDHFQQTVAPAAGLTPADAVKLLRDRTDENVYLVGLSDALPYWTWQTKVSGLDAFSVYNLSVAWVDRFATPPRASADPKSFAELAKNYASECAWMLQACKDGGLEFWVPSTSGFDARPWAREKIGIATMKEFRAHIQASADLLNSSTVCRGLLHYAVNEWGEGGWLLPDKADGHERLRIFRQALMTAK